jgi:hypothetical protein
MAWSEAGWPGACAVGAFMAATALVLWARRRLPAPRVNSFKIMKCEVVGHFIENVL